MRRKIGLLLAVGARPAAAAVAAGAPPTVSTATAGLTDGVVLGGRLPVARVARLVLRIDRAGDQERERESEQAEQRDGNPRRTSPCSIVSTHA